MAGAWSRIEWTLNRSKRTLGMSRSNQRPIVQGDPGRSRSSHTSSAGPEPTPDVPVASWSDVWSPLDADRQPHLVNRSPLTPAGSNKSSRYFNQSNESPLARLASPGLKVKMRDDERVRVGEMPREIGLQIRKLWLADQFLRDESLAQVL